MEFYKIYFHHIENVSETTYYQKNREVILKRAKDYYENKELLREIAREREQKREYEKKKIS